MSSPEPQCEKPSWVEYFMYLAFGASLRSKDPSTRVGCVIVDSQTLKILSIGYNGFPPGIPNSAKNWEKKRKTDFVVHAEANAVLLKGTANLENSIAFVTLFPCKDCAQILIQAGVRRVYYLSFREKFRESVKIFKEAGVEFLRFKKRNNETLEPFRKSFITLLKAATGHVNTLLQPARKNINTVIETAREEVNTSLQTARENVSTSLQTPEKVNTLLQTAGEINTLLETAIKDINNLFPTARDDVNASLQKARENVNTLLQTPTENVYTSLQRAREKGNSLLQTAREHVNSKAGPYKNELYEWIKKEKEDLREKDIESPWVRDDQDKQGSDEFLFKKWTDYFLFLALVASTRSSEKDDKEGAILIDVETLKMCSMSYKGYPRGVKGTPKKEVMVSAITNALALRFCEGNKFYAFCTNFPKEEEVKNLAQAKIERLYFLAPTNLSAKALSTLKDAGVEFVHALHLGVTAWMTATSSSTMSRIFVGWCVFLSSIFESIEMTPLPGFVEKYMPKDFVEAGYSDTAVIGDATEVWISQSENYDLNNITFSSYKNHTTGKICVWTVPAGFLIHCTDAYPGSISDSDITEQSQVLDYISKGKTVMTEKGFNITDLCHERGLLHNRPPMKFNSQFDETEIVKNFDIATLRIYIENYIGRVRDWQILNKCWPSTRIDLLGYCFQIFAHIVNMLKKPVGPKQ